METVLLGGGVEGTAGGKVPIVVGTAALTSRGGMGVRCWMVFRESDKMQRMKKELSLLCRLLGGQKQADPCRL